MCVVYTCVCLCVVFVCTRAHVYYYNHIAIPSQVQTLTSNRDGVCVHSQMSDAPIMQDVTLDQTDSTISEAYSNHCHVLMHTEGVDLHKTTDKVYQNIFMILTEIVLLGDELALIILEQRGFPILST